MPPLFRPTPTPDPSAQPIGVSDIMNFLPPEARVAAGTLGVAGQPSITDVLDAPRNFVRPVTGPAALGIRRTVDAMSPNPVISGNPIMDNAVRFGAALPAGIAQAQQDYHQPGGDLTGEQAYQAAVKDTSFPVHMAADIASDPLSYVGIGLPESAGLGALKIAKALGASPVVALRVANTFKYLNEADQALAHAPWQATSAFARSTLKALGSVPIKGALTVVDEKGVTSGARTLGEWGSNLSRLSQYKAAVHKLETLADSLKGLGRRLDLDQETEDAFRNMPLPGTTYEKTQTINNRLSDFRATVLKQTDPARVAWGLHLASELDSLNSRMWDQATQIQMGAPHLTHPMGGIRPTTAGKQLTSAYEHAYQSIMGAATVAERQLNHPPASILGLNTGSPQLVKGVAAKAFREVEDALTAERTALSQIAHPTADQKTGLILQRNAAIRSAYDAAQTPTASLLGGIDPVKELVTPAQRAVSSGVGEIQSFWKDRAVLRTTKINHQTGFTDTTLHEYRQGSPVANAELTDTHGETLKTHQGAIYDAAGDLRGDRENILHALTDMWRQKMGTAPVPPELTQIHMPPEADRYDKVINPVLTQMGYDTVSNPQELLNVFRGAFTGAPKRIRRLENSINRWVEGGDILNGDPYQLAIGKVIRDKSHQYGVGKNTLNAAVSTAINLWKESVLLSGTYTVTNLMGALIANSIAGIGPERTFRHLIENADVIAKGGLVRNSDLVTTLAAVGKTQMERSMSSSGILSDQSATAQALGKGLTASQRLGPAATAGIGGAIGLASGVLQPDVSPEDRQKVIALSTAKGIVGGAALPYVSKFLLSHIVRGVEDVVRQEAYNFGLVKGVNSRIPALLSDVQTVLATPFSRVGLTPAWHPALPQTRQIITETLHPNIQATALTKIQSILTANGGLISPEAVQSALLEAKVGPELARQVSVKWANHIEDAADEGMGLMGRTQVNYEVLNNVEQAIKTAAPFSTWPIKMTPFFAKHILEHPLILLPLIRLNQLSREMQDEQGLTARFHGSAPLGFGDAVFSWLLGRPVVAFHNPIRAILPFSDSAQSIERGTNAIDQGSIVGGATDLLGAAGIGLNPALDFGFRLLDPTSPAKGLIRQAEPLRGAEALLGVNQGRGTDLNAAFTVPEGIIRGALHPSTGGPPDLRQQAIQKRVDELALAATGKAVDSKDPSVAPYVLAKSAQTGEIWDKASREVARERGVSALTGFFLQSAQPQAFLSPEEAQIRGAQAAKKTEDADSGLETLRTIINDFQDQGKGNDKAPVDLVDSVTAFAQERVSTKDDLIFVARMKRVGSYNALEKVLTRVAPAPTDASAGYSSGGSPAQQTIQRQIDLYQNPAALLEQGGATPEQATKAAEVWTEFQVAPEWAKHRLIADTHYDGSYLHVLISARDQYRSSHPFLDQFLQYQDANGWSGNTKSFLQLNSSISGG